MTMHDRVRSSAPRLAAAIAAATLFAACGDGAADLRPEDPPVSTIDEPERDPIEMSASVQESQVPLGGDIVFDIELTNTSDETVQVNVPRLARRSLSFRVRRGARVQQLERLRFDLDPQTGQIRWQANEVEDLAPGESLVSQVTVVAVQPGQLAFTPQYLRRGARPIQAKPVAVEVVPEEDRSRLGVRMETSHGTMVFELRPESAYTTVESFAALTKKGFFDGLTFHRIVADFMAQGGDPTATGGGGPGYFIPGEMHEDLLHDRGVLSMARTGLPRIGKDTAGSQFFIMFSRRPDLDPGFRRGDGYTTFGKLVEGEETLKRLEAVKVGMSSGGEMSKPLETVTLEKMTLISL